MQQHLGQHILSAIFYQQYKAGTVGFHLGSSKVMIDLDRQINPEAVINSEDLANAIVFEDRGVEFFYADRNQLKKLSLRKLPELAGPIRIVRISELDTIPCSGTHPSHTGEVGLIKIINCSKYKHGTRVEFLCGKRALTDYRGKNNCVKSLSALLSVGVSEIVAESKKVIERNKALDQAIRHLNDQLLAYQAQDMLQKPFSVNKGIRIIKEVLTEQDYRQLRILALKLTAEPAVVTLLGLRDGDQARFIISRSQELKDIDMHDLSQEILPLIAGRGGGNQQLAQGGGPGIERLEELIDVAYQRVVAILLST